MFRVRWIWVFYVLLISAANQRLHCVTGININVVFIISIDVVNVNMKTFFSCSLCVSSTDEGRKSLWADVEVNSAASVEVTWLILDDWTSCRCMLWLDTVDLEKEEYFKCWRAFQSPSDRSKRVIWSPKKAKRNEVYSSSLQTIQKLPAKNIFILLS